MPFTLTESMSSTLIDCMSSTLTECMSFTLTECLSFTLTESMSSALTSLYKLLIQRREASGLSLILSLEELNIYFLPTGVRLLINMCVS